MGHDIWESLFMQFNEYVEETTEKAISRMMSLYYEAFNLLILAELFEALVPGSGIGLEIEASLLQDEMDAVCDEAVEQLEEFYIVTFPETVYKAYLGFNKPYAEAVISDRDDDVGNIVMYNQDYIQWTCWLNDAILDSMG